MAKVTVEEALIALGKKLHSEFVIEPQEGTHYVRLVSIDGGHRVVYTNFVSQAAMSNYIAERLSDSWRY